jgi:hypothetical protein
VLQRKHRLILFIFVDGGYGFGALAKQTRQARKADIARSCAQKGLFKYLTEYKHLPNCHRQGAEVLQGRVISFHFPEHR